MKRLIIFTLFVAALVATARAMYRDQFDRFVMETSNAALWLWDGIKANAVPVSFAVGTFLLTVIYHRAKGKSLRESVEVAATRVTIVPVPVNGQGDGEETLVVKRAKARTMRVQLLADQTCLQSRHRRLPEEVLKAEKEACYTEQAVVDTENKLAAKRKDHRAAIVKLEALRKEKASCDAELAEIAAELTKLADVV